MATCPCCNGSGEIDGHELAAVRERCNAVGARIDDDGTVSLQDAAAVIGRSYGHLRNMRIGSNGTSGRRVRVSIAELAALLDDNF